MFGKVPVSTFILSRDAVNSAAANKLRFRVPFACQIRAVTVAVDATSAGSSQIFDINKNGTTLFTTQANRPTVAAAAVSASVPLPDVTTLAAGDVITVDCDQVGSGTAGTGFTIAISVLPTTRGYY
jgi:hypothetical protein